jgi:Abortive infection bacteriophage resistance protein
MEVKQPTTFEEQLQKLIERDCIIADETFCKEALGRINYYRLSAYFLPFKKADGKYYEGTTFGKVIRIYEFDRKMRSRLFSLVEEIEIYLRTQFSYYFAHKYGALGYLDESSYNERHDHERFEMLINSEISNNSKTLFIKHHVEHYDGKFPIWVISELFTFGMLSHFFGDMINADQKHLANSMFKTTSKNLKSWLRCCTDLRNICAHYGRLYYRIFPAIPATPTEFQTMSKYTLGRRLFDNILMLKFLYPDAGKWNNEFLTGLDGLLEEYSDCVSLKHIGFPQDWTKYLTK